MRIVVTGASGRIGQALVPELARRGVELLLVGRDPETLRERFPDMMATGYADLAKAAKGFELVLHLAVRNNDQPGDWDDFFRDNVELTLATCRAAKAAGVKRFVFVSSTHALDAGNTHPYARSKRLAAERLAEIEGIAIETLYLPAFMSARFGGKLAMLNGLPEALRGVMLSLVKCLKPTVSLDTLADAVLAPPSSERERIVSDTQGGNPLFGFLKRSFDIVAALGLLVGLSWAMVAVWVLVRVKSSGPGIFRQVRVGREGREFVCYKFRTMQVGTPNRASHEVSASAVTGIGQFLRRTKLDELPQLFNVLAGQMSFVGPRPCLPSQTELVAARRRRGVLAIRPGITGLAQIKGIDMSDPERLSREDERYILLQGLMPDLKIMLATVRGRGGGDRVKAS
jgi:lipopolysaccharide/colanic/teichoic acid biosynthesis glycosyltransferase